MAKNEFAPVTPGEMLKQEFLAAYGLSQSGLAKAIGISPNRIAEIVNNRRRITADTALRLGLYFGNSPEFWMNLQANYDLKIAYRNLPATEADRIKAHRRELIDPKIREHQGRIVKTTGDGVLAEFASVVDAMRCAAEVQRGMLDRDA